MAFRFVHAADIHLDSPLRSLALRDSALAELIGNATRRAFVGIVDLCLAEEVDALVLAGDLYDGDQTSMKTARFLAEQLQRLHEAGIRVYIVRGNHDALSRITRELVLPDSVKVFGGRAEAVPVDLSGGGPAVVVHGLSFAQPHAPDSLLARYRMPVEGAVNVGILHTSLAGAAGHDPYAPCSVADLQATGYRYWALGHIHKRSVTEGSCTIVMPGNPQGRDVNEAGPRSVTLARIDDSGSIHVEERRTSIAQFERVDVDVTGVVDWRDLPDALAHALAHARQDVLSGHLVARLRLIGRTSLDWRIRSNLDLVKTEADLRAAEIGTCTVEKLEVDCQSPRAEGTPAADPISELRRLIDGEIAGSSAFLKEAAEIGAELKAQLPPECRDLLGTDEASFKERLADLTREGADDVLARLRARTPAGES